MAFSKPEHFGLERAPIRVRGGPVRLSIRVCGGPIRAGLASECHPRPDYGDEDGYDRAEGKANVEGDRFHAGECSTVSTEYPFPLLAKKFPLAYLEMRTVVEAAKQGRGLTAEEMREEELLALAAALKWIDLVETTAESGRGLDPAEVRRLAEW